MKNIYKVITRYGDVQNYASYYVLANSGMEAMSIISNKTKEISEEVEFIGELYEN